MFYLTIVNKILSHCNSWLARQYMELYLDWNVYKLIISQSNLNVFGSIKEGLVFTIH